MTELTVAEIAARLGMHWPVADSDELPRHLLDEPEPEPGVLTAFWFGAPAPRREARPTNGEPSLARTYVLQRKGTS